MGGFASISVTSQQKEVIKEEFFKFKNVIDYVWEVVKSEGKDLYPCDEYRSIAGANVGWYKQTWEERDRPENPAAKTAEHIITLARDNEDMSSYTMIDIASGIPYRWTALKRLYGLNNFTGIDVIPVEFYRVILNLIDPDLNFVYHQMDVRDGDAVFQGKKYDVVASFSSTYPSYGACVEHTKPGGILVYNHGRKVMRVPS